MPVIIVLVNPNSLEIIWEVIDTENTITASDHSYKILIKRENKFNKYATKKLLDISEGEKSSVSIGATCESYNYLNLGIKYEFGKEDHEVNYEKARYYYRLAADNGDKIAQFNLALLLIHGKGGSVDYSQAYVYMKKSALQDFVPAFYNLGLLFFHGKTLYKKDIDEAYFWLNKAKEKGHENAAIWLMYCELFRIIHSIKTPSVRTETIPFVDSFRNLISKVSVEDFISVIDCDIEQSNLVQWKKGLFYIASEATFNAHRHQDSEAADFWADFQKIIFSIHNYFFAKAIDQVRPGGVVALVTSHYTMDAKSPDARKYIAQRAELLGAIRLPNNAFKANAGTEVVSDILFLQKRDRPIDIEPDWVHLGQTPDGLTINSYFVDHPEMVLGELTTESTQYGREECTVAPTPGADLSEQLREAVSRIHGSYQAVELDKADIADAEETKGWIPADPDVKNFSYALMGGDVYFRENSVMKPVELSGAAKGRVTGMIGLRQIVNELIEYQLEDYPEADIEAKQAELNAAYDAFYTKYGTINSSANARVFDEDSSYYLLCSLENIDEDGRLESKADMFTKRTIRPERHITSVDTPSEALAVSIGERGRVDLRFMSELLGTPGEYERITEELRGVIFRDPREASADDPLRGWHTADDYLSGNVRDKLMVARMAAATDPAYAVNVAALEKAQPKDLDASEIDVRLGATWIDKDYIQQFMEETFDTPWRMRDVIQVKYSPTTAEWQVTGKNATGRHDVMAFMTYGTDRASAYRILEDTLNLRDIRIYDTFEDVDGKAQLVIGLVVHLVVSKGDIADTKIVEIPPVGGLESRYLDIRLRVQLLGDSPGDGIQLHTVEAAAPHGLREHPEEVAHAHAGFEDVPRLESHPLHRVIDCPDNGGGGIVGIQGGRSGGGVFLRGEGGVQFLELICPTILFLVKGVRQTAPAHIPGKDLLFLRGGVPAVKLQFMQEVDSVHIGPEFCLGAALAQVIVRDTEITGGWLLRLGVFRLTDVQFLNDHIKGQTILVAAVDGLGGGGDFRFRL